jgi:homoserine O-acetyltransferase
MKGWNKTASEADYIVPDFKFVEGTTLDVRLHYRTLGTLAPDGDNAILMLHGTTGGSKQFLQPISADFLFTSGQPLDTGRYFYYPRERDRSRRLQQAKRWIGDSFPAVLLHRHCRGAASSCVRRSWIETVTCVVNAGRSTTDSEPCGTR